MVEGANEAAAFGRTSRLVPRISTSNVSNFFRRTHSQDNSHAKMPSTLNKVTKHIHKKKGDKIKSLHENSRDARRLRRAGARDDRVARVTSVREKANKSWIDRVIFFQDRLPDTLHPMAMDDIRSLIQEYLDRNEDELSELKAERRVGRPASTRQTLLEQAMEKEAKEFESGFWMPNLRDEETLVKLDKWKGEWAGLGVLRFVRVDNRGGEAESSFPPRGAS